MAQGQIFFMTGSWGPDLSFETLKSKFDCITKKMFFLIFEDFWPKSRENINFLPIYKNLQEIHWGEVSLPHSEHFLSKNFLSSSEFSIFSHLHYIRSP